jgi:hypothetical protein
LPDCLHGRASSQLCIDLHRSANTGEVGILFELRGAKGLVRGLSLDLVFDRISAAQFRSYAKRALMPFIRTVARLPLERQDST